MNSKVYRWCGVPQCHNTSIKTPNKLFVFVPQKKTIRTKWLKLARRDSKGLTPNSTLYFCEDHFNLPNDMANYMEYHLMGSVSMIRMKPGCLPTKFECQPGRGKRISKAPDRPYIVKKQRKALIEECEKYLEESPIVGKNVKLADTPTRNSVSAIMPVAENLQKDELSRTMLNVGNMKKCFLCSEEYNKVISLQQCLKECDNLSVAQALQTLNFLPISDATTLQGSICFICVAKIQSCYEFKDLCGQIDSSLLSVNEKENESSNTSRFLLIDNILYEAAPVNDFQNLCTLVPVKNNRYKKLKTSEIHTESIETIKNKDLQQNFEISTQIVTKNSKVKSEIEMDEGSFYSTKEKSYEKNATEEYDSGKFNVIECQENSNNFFNPKVSTQIPIITKIESNIQTDTGQEMCIIQKENTDENYSIENYVNDNFDINKPEDADSTVVLPNRVPVMQLPFTINSSFDIENGTPFKRVEYLKIPDSINITHQLYSCNKCDEKFYYFPDLQHHKVKHKPKILKKRTKKGV